MTFNTTFRVGVAAAAFAMFVAPITAEATTNNAARRHHPAHHATYRSHTMYRSPMIADGERLPPAPEYGFLTHVPPNAMRMPGYTFVPGKGILGESCDLPTSACSNQYRDVQ